MTWMQDLYQTYDSIKDKAPQIPDVKDLIPLYHTSVTLKGKDKDIELTLDKDSNFVKVDRRVKSSEKKRIIPCTEQSLARTSGIAPHPLIDDVSYILGIGKKGDNKKKEYEKILKDWAISQHSHQYVKVIYKYICQGNILQNLKDSLKEEFKKRRNTEIQFADWIEKNVNNFYWIVEIPEEPDSKVWENESLRESWIKYCQSKPSPIKGLCCASGKEDVLMKNHPPGVIDKRYKAKILSSNDGTNFTFRGRFTDKDEPKRKKPLQAVNVSSEVSQKAHFALKWLIERQGFKNENQRIVAWAISSREKIKIENDYLHMLDNTNQEGLFTGNLDHSRDIGQSFSSCLNSCLRGYRGKFDSTEHVVIMGLDAVTDGRISITYYRKFEVERFLKNLKKWTEDFCWILKYKNKENKFVDRPCAPALKNKLWNTVYGENVNSSLEKNLVKRMLPCIVDEIQIPFDIVQNCIERVGRRNSFKDKVQWEQSLGIACSFYKGYHYRKTENRREYKMTLETDIIDRSYLYGRLLAIAEKIESIAIGLSKDKSRPTAAERYMQRFSQRPYSTWRIIEEQLSPYYSKIGKNYSYQWLNRYKSLIDDVCCKFSIEDFEKDNKLEGKYLLGFHCQRLWLEKYKPKKDEWVLAKEEINKREEDN